MKLSQNDLEALPKVFTIPQVSFWGFEAKVRRCVYDYNDILKVIRQREQNQPRQHCPQPSVLPTGPPMVLEPYDEQLSEEWCSIQPRPKRTIQTRRCQPALRLLSEEISPLETIYVQHACAIRLPAKSRQVTRCTEGGFQTTISTIEAVHCAGCAYHWNYHSPLPWQFHRLYPHQRGKMDTAFTRHLKHCVYARLQWTWLHNPSRPLALDRKIHLLGVAGKNTLHPRNADKPGSVENSLFEQIPRNIRLFLSAPNVDSTTFQPQYTWPESESTDEGPYDYKGQPNFTFHILERIRAETLDDHIDDTDHYWDNLVSQEAVSQATWACATVANGSICLFGGPTAVLVEKYTRFRNKWGRMPALGLSWLYL